MSERKRIGSFEQYCISSYIATKYRYAGEFVRGAIILD